MLVRFWANHHLLDITQRPLWRVVKPRSEAYVQRALTFLHEVRTSTTVESVSVVGDVSGGPVDLHSRKLANALFSHNHLGMMKH
jgi:predicted NAD/FAD-binding protein